MSEILVSGGNGFVGKHVVLALRERGYAVRVLALPDEDTSWLEHLGIAVYRGDIGRAETLPEPMRGVDRVLHLAAMSDVWRPLEQYRTVNVTGTENVCRAALAAGAERVVHMSSSSVYGIGLGRPADEMFPLAPFADPYPVTKAAGDVAVQRMIADHGLPAVIIRPDQIFGPGDRMHFGRIADRLQAGRAIIVGAGDNALPLVYITDIVEALLLALEHPRAVGQAYNITNDSPLTQREFADAIACEIGARPRRIHVPYRALYAAGCVAERAAMISRSERRPPVTRFGVAFLGTDNRCSIEKARRELGYEPAVALVDGVRLTAAWYREVNTDSSPRTGVPLAARAVEEVTG
jgi:nucleoside-diphosphate-sugar epimerase